MADSVIGALRVVLGLDTAAFSSGAKEAQSVLDQMARGFKTAIAGLGVGVIAEQFKSAIEKTINAADQMGKASQKFGVPVETLSALKYAADLADVSFESLGKGLGKLSKSMLDGAINPAGDAAKNFKALGVSLTDASGNIKSTDTVFTDIAEKFSTMQDGATKTALAIRIFGKSGADLIPLLNEGRDGLKRLTDEAARLGIVISADTAAKAQDFNDTLKRLHASHDALTLQITSAMLPALQQLANAFLQSSQEGSSLKSFMSNFAASLATDIEDVQKIALAFENLGRVLIALKNLPGDILDVGVIPALKNLDAVLEENRKKVVALHSSFLSLGTAGAFESMDNLNAQLAKVARGFGDADRGAMAAANAIDQFIKSQEKSIANTQAEAQTLGAAVGVHEAMRVTMEAQAIAQANNITLTDKQREAIKQLSDQAGAAAIQLAGAKLTQEFLSPWDQYAQKLRDINILLQENAISAGTAQKAGAQAASKLTETYGNAAATAAGNFATFFNTFAQGNETMFLVGKAFSISQAIINTYVAATKALAELGPIMGPIAAAGMIASGLAMVATIIAQKPAAKAAMGGQFQVPGAGGTDTQMVPIMMTPGERVKVDQNKYGESAGPAKTITVQGLKPKDYYRGDVLRDIVDNLNQAISDGLKIKLA